jgi:hypothetical protein
MSNFIESKVFSLDERRDLKFSYIPRSSITLDIELTLKKEGQPKNGVLQLFCF